jgi:hypothetical protein
MFKRLVIAFSLANLCYFKVWREVLNPQVYTYLYYWKNYSGSVGLLALVINVLLLTGVFYLAVELGSRYSRGWLRKLLQLGFIVLLLRSLNGVRAQFQALNTEHLRMLFGKAGFFILGMSLIAILLGAVWRYGLDRAIRVAVVVSLVLAPFGLVAATQGTLLVLKYSSLLSPLHSSQPLTNSSGAHPRIVWIVFDEMSADLVFDHRPADLKLPEFDQLASVSMIATQAFSPAGRTLQSVPALLTGKLVASAEPSGPNNLLLTFDGSGNSIGWMQTEDLFSVSRRRGINTAVVGWFHPYCRVIGDRLNKCFWQPASQNTDPEKLSLGRTIILQSAELLRVLPFTGDLVTRITQKRFDYRTAHLDDYAQLMEAATQTVADSSLDLVLVHLPVPHPPYVFDRKREAWDTTTELDYLDNLALADRALGQLRRAMEAARQWDNSTVVVSSDHWWRISYWEGKPTWSNADNIFRPEESDHRIPFLVKLPHQKTRVTYDKQLNTVITHDLLIDILDRTVETPDQLTNWLGAHPTIGETPYQQYDDPR